MRKDVRNENQCFRSAKNLYIRTCAFLKTNVLWAQKTAAKPHQDLTSELYILLLIIHP